MMTALQALIDNGVSWDTVKTVCDEAIDTDSFEDDDDKRCCIALAYDIDNGNEPDPSDYSVPHGMTVEGPYGEYRVLDDDEADAAAKDYIEDSLWAFIPSFMSCETGIDESVFTALQDKCEGANDAVRSIIDGSCGIDSFVESAISADGRGHFLNTYDGEEREYGDYYVYRTN